MHARVTTWEGPLKGLEEGIKIYGEEIVPWLRDATGYRGCLILLDREGNRALGLTLWATDEAMKDNAATGERLRAELATSVGTVRKGLEHYELALADGLWPGEPD